MLIIDVILYILLTNIIVGLDSLYSSYRIVFLEVWEGLAGSAVTG